MGVSHGCAKLSTCEKERQAAGEHIQRVVRATPFASSAEWESLSEESLGNVEQDTEGAFAVSHQRKPLCFSAQCYQLTHPARIRSGQHKDADVTLASPMLLAVADGVSQLEDLGIDGSELPSQLLKMCEELAADTLGSPRGKSDHKSTSCIWCPSEEYHGPVSLLKDAFESTSSLGSTTVVLGIMDNSTRIHGQLHPMMAILSIGDCELLLLRRLDGRQSPLQQVFHMGELKRNNGRLVMRPGALMPPELARVDNSADAAYEKETALRVIERNSRVHCVSVCEGDIVVMGSDGVFSNLFVQDIVGVCNTFMPGAQSDRFRPMDPVILSAIAQQIVQTAHTKTLPLHTGQMPQTPIGPGGKMDDTAVVVAEVTEWTQAHQETWDMAWRQKQCDDITSCCTGSGREHHRFCL